MTFRGVEWAENELCSLYFRVFPHKDAYITMDLHEGDSETSWAGVGIPEFFCASKLSWMRVFS